jgi:hypothetical protein
VPQYGPLVPGRSLRLGPRSLIDQGSYLLLIEHITADEVGFTIDDALLSLRVGEQLQGRLNGSCCPNSDAASSPTTKQALGRHPNRCRLTTDPREMSTSSTSDQHWARPSCKTSATTMMTSHPPRPGSMDATGPPGKAR